MRVLLQIPVVIIACGDGCQEEMLCIALLLKLVFNVSGGLTLCVPGVFGGEKFLKS